MTLPEPHPRALALAALVEILEHRATADAATAHWPDMPFARALLLTTLRHLGQIDTLLAAYIEKPLPARRAGLMHALRLGCAQLLLMQQPDHAAVHETVALVKAGKHKALAGMVNAVLKRIAADRPALPSPNTNLPSWLWDRWKPHYGSATVAAIAQVASQLPPLDLHTSRTFPQGARLDSSIWRMPAGHPAVSELPGYKEGAFFVQDVAASLPVRMLGAVAGQQVLDIGAAPGGKTAQLMQAGARVTALDKSAARMDRLCRNMKRLNHDVDLVVADALAYEPREPFDVVVVDAPCSATGTWRRHPEVVQITTAEDIAELAVTQRALLMRAWGWVKPGGRLLYCVCSLEREEGEEQAAWFLKQHADAALQPATLELPGVSAEGLLRTHPALMEGGMDGFFAAVFTRHAS